tara:strand:- start:6855 stop:7031 length:177 start_codon:yes stop_codon:yes gene_type:complete
MINKKEKKVPVPVFLLPKYLRLIEDLKKDHQTESQYISLIVEDALNKHHNDKNKLINT